jgi:antitoxin ParD1/3/4
MRTNIEISDELMVAAMSAGGFSTKREAVEEGLKLIARRKNYARILALGGQVMWSDAGVAPATKKRAE